MDSRKHRHIAVVLALCVLTGGVLAWPASASAGSPQPAKQRGGPHTPIPSDKLTQFAPEDDPRAPGLHSMALKPSIMSIEHSGTNTGSEAWYCDIPSGGLAPYEERVTGNLQIGFDNYYDAGTDPYPCWEIHSKVDRTGVWFDLTPIAELPPRLITAAELAWEQDWQMRAFGCSWSQGRSTIEQWTTRSGGWITGGPLNLAEQQDRSTTVDTRQVVQHWLTYPDANHGFALKVADETDGRNNDKCMATLRNVRLYVAYVVY